MHELAVTESILNITLRYAQQAEASRVTHIYIVIGRLSSIVDDSVQFYWDMISENTICAGAKLHFDRRPAKMTCQDCGMIYELEAELVLCPQCGSARVKVSAGDEFLIDSIEIEKDHLEKE
ncbi:MAG: hydrogenase maturation nickel metallochaperone HypA [Anaerolineaceae bacterium]|jgi:hydrogenase nickel incorporation protein HypA/HybF